MQRCPTVDGLGKSSPSQSNSPGRPACPWADELLFLSSSSRTPARTMLPFQPVWQTSASRQRDRQTAMMATGIRQNAAEGGLRVLNRRGHRPRHAIAASGRQPVQSGDTQSRPCHPQPARGPHRRYGAPRRPGGRVRAEASMFSAVGLPPERGIEMCLVRPVTSNRRHATVPPSRLKQGVRTGADPSPRSSYR